MIFNGDFVRIDDISHWHGQMENEIPVISNQMLLMFLIDRHVASFVCAQAPITSHIHA